MKVFNASDMEDKELHRRIAALHLFKEIRENSEEQYQRLLNYSRVHFFEPGETVLNARGLDCWLYFVVRGELDVQAADGETHLTQLLQGEVFGDISQLTRKPRVNDVRVPKGGRSAIVFAVDFEQLGDLDYHQEIHIDTKIYVYRQLVHILRWRNDCYRRKFPDNEQAKQPYDNVVQGVKDGSIEQLHGLAQQAHTLAERLVHLNYHLGALTVQDKPTEFSFA